MKKYTFLKFLVPLIMTFFFARNLVYVETKNLDSWLGGSMRMFGTIDKMLYRVCGFTVEYKGKEYFVNLKKTTILRGMGLKARIMPSEERLEKYLGEIKGLAWCYDPENDKIVISGKSNDCDTKLENSNIKNIEVYGISYEAETKIVNLSLINTHTNVK